MAVAWIFVKRGNSDNRVEVLQIAPFCVLASHSAHIKYTHTSSWMFRLHVHLIFLAEDAKLHLKTEGNSEVSATRRVSG